MTKLAGTMGTDDEISPDHLKADVAGGLWVLGLGRGEVIMNQAGGAQRSLST